MTLASTSIIDVMPYSFFCCHTLQLIHSPDRCYHPTSISHAWYGMCTNHTIQIGQLAYRLGAWSNPTRAHVHQLNMYSHASLYSTPTLDLQNQHILRTYACILYNMILLHVRTYTI